MLREWFVAVVVVPLDGRFLDGAVHPFHLSVGPGVIDLCEAVLDAVLATAQAEQRRDELRGWSFGVAWWKAELDAVVGQHDVDLRARPRSTP